VQVVARPWPAAQSVRCGEVLQGAPMRVGGCTGQGVRGGGSPTRPGVDGVAEHGSGGDDSARNPVSSDVLGGQ
jgi:hypothetical protein